MARKIPDIRLVSEDGAEEMAGEAPARPSSLLDESPAEWALRTGVSPVEMLIYTMRNRFVPIQERIQAGKAVLPYIHKKLDQDININKSISQKQLSELSDEELETFLALMSKLSQKEDD